MCITMKQMVKDICQVLLLWNLSLLACIQSYLILNFVFGKSITRFLVQSIRLNQ
ncbi:hypothetical protein NC653_040944 [Populus alba x Populus x berolinensis]|uniref:Uncharacterized protein n=1 Tax=Populus alba x Populus x berolinensis TaxID=444605 RepID=A0AAD6L9R3_9ROSI|nr:hypothetical protein NC653_040944 [Populus alba x Populus x berolinensis]